MASRKILKIVVAILFSVVAGYLLVNAKAVYRASKYALSPDSIKFEDPLFQIAKVNSATFATGSMVEKIKSEVPENWLLYPELGIKAPIFWGVSALESNDKMNYGLTHIQTTALPGNGGEGLISGHSSHYWWQKGDYKEIFATLLKAKKGDRFVINKNGLRVYQVDKIYEVGTSDYLDFNASGQEKIKLMTCVPLGTNLRRLMVEARLISVL